MAIKLDTLRRIFDSWREHEDITLNLNASDASTDAQIRAATRYPFGSTSRKSFAEQENLKEDYIAMRALLAEIEKEPSTFVSIAVVKELGPFWEPKL